MIPEVIGHRGARALFPENTVAGFKSALAAGIRSFEIDVGMTRDGVAVLSHDACLSPDLTRTSDGRWIDSARLALRDFTYADLQAFDVGRLRPGSDTAKRFPRQMPVDGATIPTLEEVLRLHVRARWTIEVKTYLNRPGLTLPPERLVEAVADVADRVGAAKRIIVQSFDWRGPRHLRHRRPELAYAWLTTKSTRAWRGGQARLPGSVVEQGGGTWSPQYRELTPRLLDLAHAAGLRVVPWTVNAPDAIVRLARWGVDGIITDDPLVARAALHHAGLEPPPHPERS